MVFSFSIRSFSILKNTGFRDIHTEISKKTAVFQGSQDYRLFMKTVVMKPYLSYLPSQNDNDTIRDLFIDLFIEQAIKTKDFLNQKSQPSIDYMRLNIRAIK
jgi:trans-aconitate 2-methyltransferase